VTSTITAPITAVRGAEALGADPEQQRTRTARPEGGTRLCACAVLDYNHAAMLVNMALIV